MTDCDFVLMGNSAYLNRGCEAITRGTMRVLRRHFGSPKVSLYSLFQYENGLEEQRRIEHDPDLKHGEVWAIHKRFSGRWLLGAVVKRAFPGALKYLFGRHMLHDMSMARAALSVGGDNYSLDYGRPDLFVELDNLALSRGKPVFLWGASVGPFDKDPAYERRMVEHLRKVRVFARETATQDYLNSLGLKDNVYRVADPAFLMEPEQPSKTLGFDLTDGGIGLNISPLLGRYCSMEPSDWKAAAARTACLIARKTDRNVYLIPHVDGLAPGQRDYEFMRGVMELVAKEKEGARIFLLPNEFNAAETKWIISRMSLFVGARTHATIAAFSTLVPTLSLGYSVKSRGINQDVYGHEQYCLNSREWSPEIVTERVVDMLSNADDIRTLMAANIPRIQELAMSAGAILKESIGG